MEIQHSQDAALKYDLTARIRNPTSSGSCPKSGKWNPNILRLARSPLITRRAAQPTNQAGAARLWLPPGWPCGRPEQAPPESILAVPDLAQEREEDLLLVQEGLLVREEGLLLGQEQDCLLAQG